MIGISPILDACSGLLGSDIVCSSNVSYSVTVPTLASVVWSKSGNLTQVGGNTGSTYTVTKGASGGGTGSITATIKNSQGQTFITRAKNVWAGVPSAPITFQVSPLYENINTIFSAHIYDSPGADPASAVWETYGCVSLHGPGSGSNASFYSCPNDGCGVIYVRTSNVCGSSNNAALSVITGSGGDCGEEPEFTDPVVLVISPNPATGETTLTIETTYTEKAFAETARWDLEVYSETQLLKTRQTGLRGQSAKIQTAGWQEGVYLVRVNYHPNGKSGEILTGKLMVKK